MQCSPKTDNYFFIWTDCWSSKSKRRPVAAQSNYTAARFVTCGKKKTVCLISYKQGLKMLTCSFLEHGGTVPEIWVPFKPDLQGYRLSFFHHNLSSIFNENPVHFILHVWMFPTMYACVLRASVVSTKAQRGRQVSCNWSYRWLGTAI